MPSSKAVEKSTIQFSFCPFSLYYSFLSLYFKPPIPTSFQWVIVLPSYLTFQFNNLSLSFFYSVINFYYQKKSAFPPETRMFKGHVWSGDIMKGDASITLQNVQFRFNGTYSCQVKNPADIQGFVGEIRLKSH